MLRVVLVVSLFLSVGPGLLQAQDGYFSDWFQRSDQAKAEQPHWVTPIATVTPGLEQEVRYDQLW